MVIKTVKESCLFLEKVLLNKPERLTVEENEALCHVMNMAMQYAGYWKRIAQEPPRL